MVKFTADREFAQKFWLYHKNLSQKGKHSETGSICGSTFIQLNVNIASHSYIFLCYIYMKSGLPLSSCIMYAYTSTNT